MELTNEELCFQHTELVHKGQPLFFHFGTHQANTFPNAGAHHKLPYLDFKNRKIISTQERLNLLKRNIWNNLHSS